MKRAREIAQGGVEAEVRMQPLGYPGAPRVNSHEDGRSTLIRKDRSQLIDKAQVSAVCIDRTQRILRIPRWRIHQVSAGVG